MADLVMTDGASLEGGSHAGRAARADGEDPAADRDIVPTRAAVLAGLEIADGEALSFLPYEWPKG